jgi:hypothetical protein
VSVAFLRDQRRDLIPITTGDQSDRKFLVQGSRLVFTDDEEHAMTSQFDPETAENNEEIEK